MERNRNKKKSITVCYHGGCVDGLYSACLIALLEYSCKELSRNFLELLKTYIIPHNKNLELLKDSYFEDLKHPVFEGKLEKLSKNKYNSSLNFVAYHHSNPSGAIKILQDSIKEKELLLILDIGNFDLAMQMSSTYSSVLFIDHHQTFKNSLNENLKNRIKIPENLTIIFNGTYCASFIIQNLLFVLPDKIIQKVFNQKFGEKIEIFKKWINENDTLDLSQRSLESREFVEAVYSMMLVKNFNEGAIERTICDFFNYDPETYIKIGKPKLEKTMDEIEEELKKVRLGEIFYKGSDDEEKSVVCLYSVTSFRNRSTLGYFMALKSQEMGHEPMSLVLGKKVRFEKNNSKKKKGKKNKKAKVVSYIVSARSLDIEKTIDVEEIARFFGGGGHKRASGFTTEDLRFIKGHEEGEDSQDEDDF